MAKAKSTAEQWVWLLGPIKVEERRHSIVFTFAGRTDQDMVRQIKLVYHADTRRFGASHSPAPNTGQWRKLQANTDKDLLGKFGTSVSYGGRLSDMLRAQLTSAHIARCTALSLTQGRK